MEKEILLEKLKIIEDILDRLDDCMNCGEIDNIAYELIMNGGSYIIGDAITFIEKC